jgi:hypothetical protein
MVLNTLVQAVRATGLIGVVGLYITEDPGSPSEEAKHACEEGYSKVVLKPDGARAEAAV